MSDIGKIGWIDLTVESAGELQDFYQKVTGWKSEPVDMGEYNDFNMCREDGEAVAGICHKKGTNSGIPSNWLIYIVVANLSESLESCVSLGGEILKPSSSAGPNAKYAIIRDPTGSCCALYQAL